MGRLFFSNDGLVAGCRLELAEQFCFGELIHKQGDIFFCLNMQPYWLSTAERQVTFTLSQDHAGRS